MNRYVVHSELSFIILHSAFASFSYLIMVKIGDRKFQRPGSGKKNSGNKTTRNWDSFERQGINHYASMLLQYIKPTHGYKPTFCPVPWGGLITRVDCIIVNYYFSFFIFHQLFSFCKYFVNFVKNHHYTINQYNTYTNF